MTPLAALAVTTGSDLSTVFDFFSFPFLNPSIDERRFFRPPPDLGGREAALGGGLGAEGGGGGGALIPTDSPVTPGCQPCETDLYRRRGARSTARTPSKGVQW